MSEFDSILDKPNPASPESDENLRLTHLFFLLCIGLVTSFGAWAHFGQLDVVSTAVGEVIPSSQVKSIQHLEGGIIRAIMVKEGDSVKRGQALVTLEPTASDADVEELQARITALRADVARLSAEASSAQVVDFPNDLSASHPKLISETRAYFDTRRQRIGNQLAGQREKITQEKDRIAEISGRIENSKIKLKLLREQISISKELMKDQLTNRMQHLNLLKEATTLKGHIAEDRAALKQAGAAHKGAANKLEAIRHSFNEKVREDLEKKRRSLEDFTSRLRKYEDSQRRTVLRSPVDGVVKSLYVFTVGGVVAPGGTLIDIVPGDDRLIIEARLPPQEIGYVSAGQDALVTLTSADASRFGHLGGTVTNVSPDTIRSQDGQVFYKVRIETEFDYFQYRQQRYRLVPGVQVMTSIRTGQRSVLAYLADPFISSARHAMRER
jgi:membrane fusion protein, adhesin transport system